MCEYNEKKTLFNSVFFFHSRFYFVIEIFQARNYRKNAKKMFSTKKNITKNYNLVRKKFS